MLGNADKIATHDSVTGEKGKGFLSWLLAPFACTQNKVSDTAVRKWCLFYDILGMIKV